MAQDNAGIIHWCNEIVTTDEDTDDVKEEEEAKDTDNFSIVRMEINAVFFWMS